MNLRTWARVLIAVSFSISGLVETLSATGLVLEFSPDGRWGGRVHTLAVSGPLQILGAALLASGRKTRWTLGILGGYVFLVSVFGNLPLIFSPDVGGNAIAGLLSNLAVMGGILYSLHNKRIPGARRAKPALPVMNSAPALPVRLLTCQDSSKIPAPAQMTRHTAAPHGRSGPGWESESDSEAVSHTLQRGVGGVKRRMLEAG